MAVTAAAEVVVAVVVAAVAVTVIVVLLLLLLLGLVFVIDGTVFTEPVKHNFYATAHEKFESVWCPYSKFVTKTFCLSDIRLVSVQ